MPKRDKEADTPSTPVEQASRRHVIKTVLAGGGIAATAFALPKEWTKPVVEAIVVPVHAGTSPAMTTAGTTA